MDTTPLLEWGDWEGMVGQKTVCQSVGESQEGWQMSTIALKALKDEVDSVISFISCIPGWDCQVGWRLLHWIVSLCRTDTLRVWIGVKINIRVWNHNLKLPLPTKVFIYLLLLLSSIHWTLAGDHVSKFVSENFDICGRLNLSDGTSVPRRRSLLECLDFRPDSTDGFAIQHLFLFWGVGVQDNEDC